MYKRVVGDSTRLGYMEIRKRRYIGRIVALLLTMPLVVFVALLTLLYLPPVQRWAVEKAARVASDATGLDIHVGSLRLAFPLDLALTDVAVCDTIATDTLVSLGEFRTGIAVRPLLHGQIQVGRIDLRDVQAQTDTLIPTVSIDGRIGRFRLEGSDIDLANENAELGNLLLEGADVSVTLLPDNAPKDSVSSPVGWNFFLGRAEISQVDFRLRMPADTMDLSVGWEETILEKLTVNLEDSSYGATNLTMTNGQFTMAPSGIAIERANLQLDSLYYKGIEAQTHIRQISLRERSGIHLTNTVGEIRMDSSGISLPQLRVETPSSMAQASVLFPWSALKENGKGKLSVNIRGQIGKADVRLLSGGNLPTDFIAPLHLRAEAYGNMQHFRLDTLDLRMDSIAGISARGEIRHLTDEMMRTGDVRLQLENFLKEFRSGEKRFAIPQGIRLDAAMNVVKTHYGATLAVREGKGTLNATGHYDTRTEEYALEAQMDSVALHQFLPSKPLKEFSAYANVAGRKNGTLSAQVKTGDFDLGIHGKNGIERLIRQAEELAQRIQRQIQGRNLKIEEVKESLPDVTLMLNAGADNLIAEYLREEANLRWESVDMMMDISPLSGMNGYASVHGLQTDTLELDTIRLNVRQDSSVIHYQTIVSNAPDTQKPAFKASLEGEVCDTMGSALLIFHNDKGEKGVDIGVKAMPKRDGLHLTLFPEHPTIGFRPFTLDEDNYVFLSDSGRIAANINILDQAGMGLRLYSTPNEEALQDLTIDLKQLNLEEILKLLPYAPEITGMLDAELHYIKQTEENSFSGTLQVNKLSYEKYDLGTLGAEAVYLPTQTGEHLINLQLMRNDEMIGMADGKLEDSEAISLDILLEHFPMEIANAFVPRDIITLKGALNGELHIQGTTQSPHMEGEIRFDSIQVHSPLYAMDFYFDKTPVSIADNQLVFADFNIYSKGKNPMTLTGNVNLEDPAHIQTDLRIRATEYELLNAKRNKNSVLHGKMSVSLFSTIKGELTSPVVRGEMKLLGNTDVTYILKESALTVEDRLGSMVTFVNFNDTTETPETKKEVSLGGLDMLMNVQIDPGAQVQVDLGNDNYVEVQGGGTLAMQYTPQGDLLLTGQYTLDGGEMKYSLPVIPLKTFNITRGSYVKFTGEATNPYLNITATERVRTSVTEEKNTRYVNFDVGVTLTGTLEDMDLAFTLNAPEDVALQNQLAAMSVEERGKLAVTMLVTGMYAGNQGGAGGFSTSNALNSFLQSEISNIAGSALKTVDVSIGVEDKYASDGSGQEGTDYAFRFAKRFWNNRLSVIIGGRISTGNETMAEENNSFIDDISLEWRLDDSGTRYVRLFHIKNYESILEGEIVETGVGLVLRRKVNNLGELFIFRRGKKQTDSLPKGEIHRTGNRKD